MSEIEALQQVNAFNPLPHQHQLQPQAHQPVQHPQVHIHQPVFNPVHQPGVSVAGVPSYTADAIFSEYMTNIDATFDQPGTQASTAAHGGVLLIMPLPFVTPFLLHLNLIRTRRRTQRHRQTRTPHRSAASSWPQSRVRVDTGCVRRASGLGHRPWFLAGTTVAAGSNWLATWFRSVLRKTRRAPIQGRTGHARLFPSRNNQSRDHTLASISFVAPADQQTRSVTTTCSISFRNNCNNIST